MGESSKFMREKAAVSNGEDSYFEGNGEESYASKQNQELLKANHA
jgi:hypothetical protein